MSLVKVRATQFKVGEAVDSDIFDNNGLLLLKRGAVITSSHQLLQLTERGFCEPATIATNATNAARRQEKDESAEQPLEDDASPFLMIESCAFRLGRILYNLTQGQQQEKGILTLSRSLAKACEKDQDAALGAVHLLHGHAYTTIHPIHSAVLAHFLCSVLGTDEQETTAIVAAAFTSNIGMLDLQETLHTQTAPLTEPQKRGIQNHPTEGVELLKKNGINNDYWLKTVLEHHERINGEGYPQGLKGDDIVYGAKILAVADVYSAMISPRAYRETMIAKEALKNFLLSKGQDYDESLSLLLIKYMGVFPPGSFVKLANGDTAVVVRRGADSMCPAVASIIQPNNQLYIKPMLRDTRSPDFLIKGMVQRNPRLNLNLPMIWGYV